MRSAATSASEHRSERRSWLWRKFLTYVLALLGTCVGHEDLRDQQRRASSSIRLHVILCPRAYGCPTASSLYQCALGCRLDHLAQSFCPLVHVGARLQLGGASVYVGALLSGFLSYYDCLHAGARL